MNMVVLFSGQITDEQNINTNRCERLSFKETVLIGYWGMGACVVRLYIHKFL